LALVVHVPDLPPALHSRPSKLKSLNPILGVWCDYSSVCEANSRVLLARNPLQACDIIDQAHPV